MLKIKFVSFVLCCFMINSIIADSYFKKNIKHIIEKGNHNEYVEIEAKIIAQVDKNTYLIKDSTGQMTAYIKSILFHKKMSIGVPFNKTIIIAGSIDKQNTILDNSISVLKVNKFNLKKPIEVSYIK